MWAACSFQFRGKKNVAQCSVKMAKSDNVGDISAPFCTNAKAKRQKKDKKDKKDISTQEITKLSPTSVQQ